MLKKALFGLVAVLIIGCGPSYHLKRAARHELIAISKGAKIEADTVYVKVPLIVKETALDSIFVTLPGDTIVLTKDRLQVKFVDLPGDSIFIEGKCEADTIYKEVPVTVTKVVHGPKSGLQWWWLIVAAAIGLIIGVLKR